MALFPWELSIEDGELSAWLHGKLNVDGNIEIINGDIIVNGGMDIQPNSGNATFKLITPTGNDWSIGGNTTSNIFYIYDITNSINRFQLTNLGRIGINLGADSPSIDFALGDVDTGLDLIGADDIAIVAGGVEGMRIKEAAGIVSTHFPEITTPVAISNFGSLYTKTDNLLYFQSGDGIEHVTSKSEENYGEAYIYNNTTPTVIETINTPIALRQISAGDLQGFSFQAGNEAVITSYSDYSGTVAGTVRLTLINHALHTGDIVTIRGSTNYNGVFEVTVIDEDWVYITATWAGNDGNSHLDKGSNLTVGADAAGKYPAFWQMSIAPDAACKIQVQMFINTTVQVKSTAEREFAINDLDSISSSCILTVVAGDKIWLAVQSDEVDDITNKHGNFNLRKL